MPALTGPKVFDAAYTAELKILEPRLEYQTDRDPNNLDEIAKTDPRAKQVTAQRLIERRFLAAMEKTGRSTAWV